MATGFYRNRRRRRYQPSTTNGTSSTRFRMSSAKVLSEAQVDLVPASKQADSTEGVSAIARDDATRRTGGTDFQLVRPITPHLDLGCQTGCQLVNLTEQRDECCAVL